MKKRYYVIGIIVAVIIVILVTPIKEIIFFTYLNSIEMTEITVKKNTLHLDGVINSKTPDQIRSEFEKNPNIDTIMLHKVEGSIDDDSNLEIATYVANKKIVTRVNRYSFIASGGTDFFLAGATRIVENGAIIGVHSWGGPGGESATDFPREHEYHQPYIDFYLQAGFSQQEAENFYYFTIEKAPVDAIHMMTNKEILEYNISNTGITKPAIIDSTKEKERESLRLELQKELEESLKK